MPNGSYNLTRSNRSGRVVAANQHVSIQCGTTKMYLNFKSSTRRGAAVLNSRANQFGYTTFQRTLVGKAAAVIASTIYSSVVSSSLSQVQPRFKVHHSLSSPFSKRVFLPTLQPFSDTFEIYAQHLHYAAYDALPTVSPSSAGTFASLLSLILHLSHRW